MIQLIDRRNCQRWQAASITSPNRERRRVFFVFRSNAPRILALQHSIGFHIWPLGVIWAIKFAMKAITDYFNPHRVKYSEMHNKKDVGWRRNQSVNYQQLPSGTQRIFPCIGLFSVFPCSFVLPFADG